MPFPFDDEAANTVLIHLNFLPLSKPVFIDKWFGENNPYRTTNRYDLSHSLGDYSIIIVL